MMIPFLSRLMVACFILLMSFAAVVAFCQESGPLRREQVTSRQRQDSEEKIVKSRVQWQRELTAEQFDITRNKGTEPPFANRYWNHKQDGVYRCVCCDHELFDSKSKFESGTGWPSFYRPVREEAVAKVADYSQGMVRVEVVCRRCDAHLGHVFDDVPANKGLRYCMNSAALKFENRESDYGAKSVDELVQRIKSAAKQKSREAFLKCTCWNRLSGTTRRNLNRTTPTFMKRELQSVDVIAADEVAVIEGFAYNVEFLGYLALKYEGLEDPVQIPFGTYKGRYYLASLVRSDELPSEQR